MSREVLTVGRYYRYSFEYWFFVFSPLERKEVYIFFITVGNNEFYQHSFSNKATE